MTCEQILARLSELANTKNVEGMATAERIATLDSKAARWIASDALKELQGEKVQEKLRRKAAKQ